jgi:ribosomal protein S12 methylthiotransferase accessory factor
MTLSFYDQPLAAPAALRDGTHRAAALEATWRRFSPLAGRIGLTRLADVTGLDTVGIPVVSAIRPMGRSLSTQQGKGRTLLAAKVSALMESIETWHAEELALPVRRASARELARAVGAAAVAPLAQLPRAPREARPARRTKAAPKAHAKAKAKAGRATREGRGQTAQAPASSGRGTGTTPRLPLAATPLPWVQGFELRSARPMWVPREAVTLDCVLGERQPIFDISSNGLASGNCLVEAILHGVCEVIERDAEAAWRREGGQRRLVLDSVRDAGCVELIERFNAAGARVVVWDLTSDVGVPVMGCAVLEDPDEPAWRALGLYQGFGCHPAPEIALARALTEAAQTRLTYIAGARDDFFPFDYERSTDRELLRQIWEELATTPYEPVMFDDLPSLASDELGDDLEAVVARLAACGSEQVIAVDLSRSDLGVPVVKVVVPGRACDVSRMG